MRRPARRLDATTIRGPGQILITAPEMDAAGRHTRHLDEVRTRESRLVRPMMILR